MEMPLRLIGRFDQRWRDTPVKNQQPPVPLLSLCIPLFLHPSFSLSVALSISSLYITSSLICPTFSLPLLFLLLHLSPSLAATLSCANIQYTYQRVRAAVLFPPRFSSFQPPRWLLSHAHRRQKHRTDGP